MTTPKQITVDAKTFSRYLKARRLASAITRLADKLKESFPLPVASKETAGEYIIVDGNKQAIGKLTINLREGYAVKAGYVSRIS
jgi:hypothetical protein